MIAVQPNRLRPMAKLNARIGRLKPEPEVSFQRPGMLRVAGAVGQLPVVARVVKAGREDGLNILSATHDWIGERIGAEWFEAVHLDQNGVKRTVLKIGPHSGNRTRWLLPDICSADDARARISFETREEGRQRVKIRDRCFFRG